MSDNRMSAKLGWEYPELSVFVKQERYPRHLLLRGLCGSALSLAVAQLHRSLPILCILDTEEEANYLYSDLEQLVGESEVLLFPSAYRRAIRYGHREETNVLLRSMVFYSLASGKVSGTYPIIITYPEAIAERVNSLEEIQTKHLKLHKGETIDQQTLREQLTNWGFERVDYVYEPGQFAIRGSIVDIYSYTHELPYRLDFFDNEIDSIRIFEIESQLSVEQLTEIAIIPDLSTQHSSVDVENQPQYSLFDLLSPDTYVLSTDGLYWQEVVQTTYTKEPQIQDEDGFGSLSELQRQLVTPVRLDQQVKQFGQIYLRKTKVRSAEIVFSQELQPLYNKQFDQLAQELTQWERDGYQLYLSTQVLPQYQRTIAILEEHHCRVSLKHLPLTLHEGFLDHNLRLVVLTEHQLFGRYHKYNLRSEKARSGKLTLSLKELSTFSIGDLVVHTDHGIGRFGGLMTMDVGGKAQEVVKVIYKNNDTIYVNVHSLHKLSHYRNKDEGAQVSLSALGSGAWQRIKERTKKQVKDIARDLIKLYAQRKETEGFSFSSDSYLQHELEASFIYEDTPDQAKTTAEVKADMERPFPMDRLICGDVGFGKTEIAIRAAFKAASDSKQVAVLVPTTVLAYQHYRTFSERLKDFPVRVEYVSRARTNKDIKQLLKSLELGEIDIIIGTHRLTSKDVTFKDLGLLIIDEEQKFGVATKEKLRKLQVNVDTLTMSATPIPRTLQFSLMGARDLSNLNTPPSNRYPVETILTRFEEETITEAINFELSRNGQVYFVHNRIQNIQEIADTIGRLVPDARIAVGHGQLSPSDLEQLIIDFTNYEYDVLVATTIIENGIDVGNANTIVINDAHKYGLSELHQLRGRVGRSNRKAFCYLLSPPVSSLPDDSRRRLKAIENFSDLGSGVRIALQDLDIRGAGNALGAEQSGFIADMGYETYQKVFEEAVSELKASEFSSLYQNEVTSSAEMFVVDTQVETDLGLRLSEDYVPSDAERILLYRELDNLKTDEELDAFQARLVDRFGNPPAETQGLIFIPRLRRLGRMLGLEKIILRNEILSLHLVADVRSPYYKSNIFDRLLQFVGQNSWRCEFRKRNDRHMIHIKEVVTVEQAIDICIQIMQTQV